MRAAPPGIASRLPPEWRGNSLITRFPETSICELVGYLLHCAPLARNLILIKLTPEDRAWVFHTFDKAPETVKSLMLTSIWIECRLSKTMGRVILTEADVMKRLGVLRCLHCHELFHSIDRKRGYPLCLTCASDIEFIGLNLRDSIQKLRRGEKIA